MRRPRRTQRPLVVPPARPSGVVPEIRPGANFCAACAIAALATAAGLAAGGAVAAVLVASAAWRTNCLATSNSRSSWLAFKLEAEHRTRRGGQLAADGAADARQY